MARIDEDELIEHWTLIGGELAEVAGKRDPTRLAFALLLKFYTRRGRFPRGRGELPDEAVAYVARQVKVPASDLGLYEWSGRTFEYHRVQIRTFLGFRECTVADAGKLTAWLAEHACHRERHPERVREELLGHCRDELIEPPSANRIGRIISSALHQADTALTLRISARIPPAAAARMLALIAESRETRTCGVAAIESVTDCHAASAAARARASGAECITPGVSAAGNVDLARWPGSVATDVRPFGCKTGWFSVRDPSLAAKQSPDLNEWVSAVVRPPMRGPDCFYGANAPPNSCDQ